jgi:RimJ/RimL family protein N-acetyltransferase
MEEKDRIEITLPANDIILASIDKGDIGMLRKWKNKNRESFFYKGIITESGQRQWYKKYLTSRKDYIFTILYKGIKIGCIGYREIEDTADIYNVILGKTEFGKKGLMGRALKMLCSYLYDNITRDIRAKVLQNNQAMSWYIKNDFVVLKEEKDYFLLQLDINIFHYLKYNLEINKE